MAQRINVYLHQEHINWLSNQPRSFNFSKFVREQLDIMIEKTDTEVEIDEHKDKK